MDIRRKKRLMEEYKQRRPEMGVICLRSRETGEAFLGASRDVRADFNSLRFKLNSDGHPNQRLQQLWRQYGEKGFELSVLEHLDYEDPLEDHAGELEKLREEYLTRDQRAKKIWR